jgi:two-component system response regulator RegX3
MTGRLLVVDDDPGLLDVVSYALEREGYDVVPATDGDEALERARGESFDVVVLDIMLPGISGIDVLRELRGESAVPILMLTAKDAEVDRVLGLELGADDYVTKPFSTAELVSRIRALIRRRELDRREGDAVRELGGLRIDLLRHEVTVDGRRVPVTRSELKLLDLLSREPGRAYSRRELMHHLWDTTAAESDHACDVHMSNLRRKLESDPSSPEWILTVRGIGYKLNAS